LSWLGIVIGGFLVGFGARLAGGCTGLHGYTGLPSVSRRSLAALVTMTISGMLMATIRANSPFLVGKSAQSTLELVVSIIQYVIIGILGILFLFYMFKWISSQKSRKYLISFFTGLLFGFGLMISGLCR